MGLRGQRQWPLLLLLHALGISKHRRGIFRGRRGLARELGLTTDVGELWVFVPGRGRLPVGRDRDYGGRNTRRRVSRLEQLGLVRLVTPCRPGPAGPVGGGRLRGSTAAHFIGRAVRIYPGPELYPSAIVDRWIQVDDLVEAGMRESVGGVAEAVKAGRELTAGELLQLDEAHRLLARRPPRGPDP
jgi:hypothetical protein